MRLFLNLLFLPVRIVITVFIWVCMLLLWISGKILGLAVGLLMLLALAVLIYSVKNAIILFVLALLISPVGIPMIAVGVLAVLGKIRNLLYFA